jgi:hypothetical protein
VKVLCQINIMGISVSFSFVGSVRVCSDQPFSSSTPESCNMEKGNQWQLRIFLCIYVV